MDAHFEAAPIVIGVSGSPSVAAASYDRLRAAFGGLLERLAGTYAHTPLLVLSALETEADFFAAQEALTRGHFVMACLRQSPDDYEREFSVQKLERFRAIISKCTRIIVAGSDAAAFLAYYSTLVVTLWDGAPGPETGGVAEVTRLRETGVRMSGAQGSPSYSPDVGPVFQIVAPAEGAPEPPGAFEIHEIYPDRPGLDLRIKKKRAKVQTPDARAKSEFETILLDIDRFNRDVAREVAPSDADALTSFQVRTDRASDRLQKWTLHSLRWLYVVGGIAIAAQLLVQQPLSQVGPVASGLRIGLLAVAALWYKIAKREDYENRYQDYRAISEALRIQRAWCSAGLRDRLVESSYLQMQQTELQWIRLALRTIYLVADARKPEPADSPHGETCSAWILGQRDYYEAAARRQAKKQWQSARVSGLLLGLGGAVSGVAVLVSLLWAGFPAVDRHLGPVHIALAHAWSLSSQWPNVFASHAFKSAFPNNIFKLWLLYLMTVPAALLGMVVLLLQFYSQQRAYSENARRYQRMFVVFDVALRRLRERAGDAMIVLSELGHEALSEQADWLILHRERPLRLISGVANVQDTSAISQ